MDTWELIQSGQFQKACEQADLEYQQGGKVFPLRNKVYALLLLKRYDEVISLSEVIIRDRKRETDSDFIACGIAYWMKRDQDKAIEVWLSAETCKYTDAAGGVELQLILYFAGVKIGDEKLRLKSLKRIEKLVKAKVAVNWPGPLGKFLLNQMDANALLAGVPDIPVLKARQLCQFSFVKAFKELEVKNRNGYVSELHTCVSFGPAAYIEQVFYLAKGELESAEVIS
jgi:hypothetical protein